MNVGIVAGHARPRLGRGTNAACPQVPSSSAVRHRGTVGWTLRGGAAQEQGTGEKGWLLQGGAGHWTAQVSPISAGQDMEGGGHWLEFHSQGAETGGVSDHQINKHGKQSSGSARTDMLSVNPNPVHKPGDPQREVPKLRLARAVHQRLQLGEDRRPPLPQAGLPGGQGTTVGLGCSPRARPLPAYTPAC